MPMWHLRNLHHLGDFQKLMLCCFGNYSSAGKNVVFHPFCKRCSAVYVLNVCNFKLIFVYLLFVVPFIFFFFCFCFDNFCSTKILLFQFSIFSFSILLFLRRFYIFFWGGFVFLFYLVFQIIYYYYCCCSVVKLNVNCKNKKENIH